MTVLERLNKKTVKAGECWLWQGDIRNGYGLIRFDGRMESVHRVSANLFLNYDLFDLKRQVNHQMFCTNKNCWNPSHIYVGSQRSNMLDGAHIGQSRKTHCPQGHPYIGRNLLLRSNGNRECRICHNKNSLIRYHKKKLN